MAGPLDQLFTRIAIGQDGLTFVGDLRGGLSAWDTRSGKQLRSLSPRD